MRKSTLVDRPPRHAGFSMIEAGIVVLIAGLVAGFTLLNINGMLPGMAANEALSQTMGQLRIGRESAIAQRRNVEVKFLGNKQIQLIRYDMPAGNTVLSDVSLRNGIQFCLSNGVPDTPDSFGNGAAVSFGNTARLLFLSDGTLVDDQGNPLNGSVFLGLANYPETARAVTILGATGRVRGYRWTGNAWIQ